MEPTCIGIDVSKDRLDVACHPAGEAFAVGRDAAGLDALVERLRPLAPQLVALEATGGYESVVSATLGAAGLPVVVVNPAQVRDFARALGRRAKTDPIDAAVIAHFAAATRPGLRPLPDAATEHLAALLARRRQAEAADFGQPTAAMTRLRVSVLPSEPLPVPGVGRPRWLFELIRARAGESADFELEACDATGRLAVPADLVHGPAAAEARRHGTAG